MERAVEEAPDGLRRARWWTVAAFLLLLTGVWLPWWAITIEGEGFESTTTQRLWGIGDTGGETRPAAVWVTSALVGLAALWIFVRVAGRSWLYEPDAWQRDILIEGGLVAAALTSTWMWPTRVPFWGERDYGNTTVGEAEALFLPGLGWWAALAALACLVAAWALGRNAALEE